jgi:periplasmic protein TonB
MTAGEWDTQQLASNGLALLLTIALSAVWWVVQAEWLRDASRPIVAASPPGIEVTLQQELPPTPAVPAELPPPIPPKEQVHRAVRRIAPAPAEPVPAPAATESVPDGGAVVAAASPPASSMPAPPARPDLEAQYAAGLRANIDQRTRPPDSAAYRLRRPSGEVRVGFVLIRSGEIKAVHVLRSSGSPILDDAAVAIVSTGRYPPMSANLFAGEAEHVFSVTIEFRRSS